MVNPCTTYPSRTCFSHVHPSVSLAHSALPHFYPQKHTSFTKVNLSLKLDPQNPNNLSETKVFSWLSRLFQAGFQYSPLAFAGEDLSRVLLRNVCDQFFCLGSKIMLKAQLFCVFNALCAMPKCQPWFWLQQCHSTLCSMTAFIITYLSKSYISFSSAWFLPFSILCSPCNLLLRTVKIWKLVIRKESFASLS